MNSIDLTKVQKLADEVWDTVKFKFDGDANHRIFVRKVKAENGEKEKTVCEMVVESFDTRRTEKLANTVSLVPVMVGVMYQVFLAIGDNETDETLRSIKHNVRQVLEEL